MPTNPSSAAGDVPGRGKRQVANSPMAAGVLAFENRTDNTGRNSSSDGTTGQLSVGVISAHNLTAMDVGGASDPYCVVRVGKSTKQTSISLNTLQPEWKEVLTFKVVLPTFDQSLLREDYYVTIEIWDHDKLNQDDFLGASMLPLAFLTEKPTTCLLPLGRISPSQKVSGEVLVTLSLKSSSPGVFERCDANHELYEACLQRNFHLDISSGMDIIQLPGPSERVEMVLNDILVEISGWRSVAQVYLTDYRLVLICHKDKQRLLETGTDLSMWVALSNIVMVERSESDQVVRRSLSKSRPATSHIDDSPSSLLIMCSDFRTIRLTFVTVSSLSADEDDEASQSSIWYDTSAAAASAGGGAGTGTGEHDDASSTSSGTAATATDAGLNKKATPAAAASVAVTTGSSSGFILHSGSATSVDAADKPNTSVTSVDAADKPNASTPAATSSPLAATSAVASFKRTTSASASAFAGRLKQGFRRNNSTQPAQPTATFATTMPGVGEDEITTTRGARSSTFASIDSTTGVMKDSGNAAAAKNKPARPEQPAHTNTPSAVNAVSGIATNQPPSSSHASLAVTTSSPSALPASSSSPGTEDTAGGGATTSSTANSGATGGDVIMTSSPSSQAGVADAGDDARDDVAPLGQGVVVTQSRSTTQRGPRPAAQRTPSSSSLSSSSRRTKRTSTPLGPASGKGLAMTLSSTSSHSQEDEENVLQSIRSSIYLSPGPGVFTADTLSSDSVSPPSYTVRVQDNGKEYRATTQPAHAASSSTSSTDGENASNAPSFVSSASGALGNLAESTGQALRGYVDKSLHYLSREQITCVLYSMLWKSGIADLTSSQHQAHRPVVSLQQRLEFVINNAADCPPSKLFVRQCPRGMALDGWSVFDMKAEMARLNVSDRWRCVRNTDICATYPDYLYVPSAISDQAVRSCANFRSKGRLPVLCWYNAKRQNGIMRCAQPLPGAMGKYSVHDEDVIKAARLTCPTEDLVIFDARSRVAAGGNMLKGKGTEDTVNRYKSCKLLFLDIANIHAMRESIDKLHKVCCNPSNTHWFSQLESSQWLNHCSSVLRGCYVIARHVEDRGVMAMIHCSDGWDRTSQLSSLAQLLLDSFYRTFDGFKLLVEKEWLAFGHKFEHRLGHPMHPSERSPVFLQFLDCTWQILHQFPTAFEFNEDYLLAIANHHNTGWFGTFLCNSNQERHRTFTNKACVSLWAYLDAQRGPLLNSTFVETTELLRPQTSLRRMQLWFTYLLQYDEASLAARSDMDEDSPQIPSKSSDTTVVVWVPNERAPQCHDCHQNFTTLRRKHHCRGCGQVFCGECTRQRIRLPKFGYYKPERVCDNCFHIYADDDMDTHFVVIPTPKKRSD